MQGRQQAGLSTSALWPGWVAARCYPEMPRVLISLDSRHPERLLSAVLRRRWSGVASQGSPEPGGSGRPQVRLGVESQLCPVPRCDSCHRRVTGAVCRQEDKQPGTWSASQPGAVLVPRPHLAARGAEPERGPSPPTSPPREQRRPVRTSRPPGSHRSPRPRAGAATRAPGCPARWRQGLCVARRSPGSSRPVLLSPCSTSTASARSRARPPGSRPAPRGVSRSPSPERPEDASPSARTPERPARARAL